MKNYDLIIFDLDGTLFDTSEGIINSYLHIIREYDLERKKISYIKTLIGGDLYKTIKTHFNLDDIRARKAIESYRQYYKTKGKLEFCEYNGIIDCLKRMKNDGKKIAVATLKFEEFAVDIINSLGIKYLFDFIFGMDENDNFTKKDMIEKCINNCFVEKSNTLMVGDSLGDYIGANEAGVDFAMVTYGFGFKDKHERNGINCVIKEDLPEKLYNKISMA